MEISRQRLRPAAVASSYTSCPMCEGHGSVRTPESAALGILRKIHHRIAEGDVALMNVTLPRDVAMYLLNQKRDDLAVLERRYAARIQVVASDKLMPHQSEIETRTREVTAPIAVVRPGEVAPAERAAPANGALHRSGARRAAPSGGAHARGPAAPARESEDGEATGQRRRRRGGRGRRGDAAETSRPAGDASPAATAVESVEDVPLLEPVREPVPPLSPAAAITAPGDAAPTGDASVAADDLGELAGEDGSSETIPLAAAVDGYWIESLPVFIPVDAGGMPADAAQLQADAARRRRRRGGRRGGRGRRASDERREDASPATDGAVVAAGEEPSASASSNDPARAPARRRRRRGGSGRRRPDHQGRGSGEGTDTASSAAVSAPAEPPVES